MTIRVLHVFGAMNRGGAEMRTLSLMAPMKEKNVQFDYCALSGKVGVLDSDIRLMGGIIHYLELGPLFLWHFYKLLRQHRYTIVHSHVALVSGIILLVARIAGVKIRIAHFRNTTDGGQHSVLRTLRNTFLRFLLRWHSTHILAVCIGAFEGFLRHDWRKDRKCQVIYNGFEVPRLVFEERFWQRYIRHFSGQKIVLNVARMDIQKNHLRQIDIFFELQKKMPDTLLVFVGKTEPEKLKQSIKRAESLGISAKVCILGLQHNPLDFMAQANVMLFPSLWEGLPGVVLEAASVGLSVVASDLPGINEIAEKLRAVTIVSLDESNLTWASALSDFLQRPADGKQLIEQFAQSEFKLSNNIQQLYDIYVE